VKSPLPFAGGFVGFRGGQQIEYLGCNVELRLIGQSKSSRWYARTRGFCCHDGQREEARRTRCTSGTAEVFRRLSAASRTLGFGFLEITQLA